MTENIFNNMPRENVESGTEATAQNKLPAQDWNRVVYEVNNTIKDAGITPQVFEDNEDLSVQQSQAIMHNALCADFFSDYTTDPNNLILDNNGTFQRPTKYINGMKISFVANYSNTYEACSVNVCNLGSKRIFNSVDKDFGYNCIKGGKVNTIVYREDINAFILATNGIKGQETLPLFFTQGFDHDPEMAGWVSSRAYIWLDQATYVSAYTALTNQCNPEYSDGTLQAIKSYGTVEQGSSVYILKFNDGSTYNTTVSKDGSFSDLTTWLTAQKNTSNVSLYGYSGTSFEDLSIWKDLAAFGYKKSETIGNITVQYIRTFNGMKIILPDQIANAEALFAYIGYQGYYILDTQNYRFKLPRYTQYDRYTQGDNAGEFEWDGAPNIQGSFHLTGFASATSGAFSTQAETGGSYDGTGTGTRVSFNAQNGNSVYGRVNDVHPRTITKFLYFYLGIVQNDIPIINANNIIETVNNKLDTDFSNANLSLTGNGSVALVVGLVQQLQYNGYLHIRTNGISKINIDLCDNEGNATVSSILCMEDAIGIQQSRTTPLLPAGQYFKIVELEGSQNIDVNHILKSFN